MYNNTTLYNALHAAYLVLDAEADNISFASLLIKLRKTILQPFSPPYCEAVDTEEQQIDLLLAAADLCHLGSIKKNLSDFMLLLQKTKGCNKYLLSEKLYELMKIVAAIFILQKTPATIQQFLDADGGHIPKNGIFPANYSVIVRDGNGDYVRAELPFAVSFSKRLGTWFAMNPDFANNKGGQGEVAMVVQVTATAQLTLEVFNKGKQLKIKMQPSQCDKEVHLTRNSGFFATTLSPQKKGKSAKTTLYRFLSEFSSGERLDIFLQKDAGRQLSMQKILFIFSHLLYQLSYYVADGDKERWIHGDFKLNNVILNEITLMPDIIDYGMSQFLSLPVKSAVVSWTPLEEFANEKYDIFSLGLALCQMLGVFNLDEFCSRLSSYRTWFSKAVNARVVPDIEVFADKLKYVSDALPSLFDISTSLCKKYLVSVEVGTSMAKLIKSMLELDVEKRASFDDIKLVLDSIMRETNQFKESDGRVFIFDPSLVKHCVASAITFNAFVASDANCSRKRIMPDGSSEYDSLSGEYKTSRKFGVFSSARKALVFDEMAVDTKENYAANP